MDAMTVHPADQTLRSYGLGRLDDASSEAVDWHLERCPDCLRRVAELSSDSFLGLVRDAHAHQPAVPSRGRPSGITPSSGRAASASPPAPPTPLAPEIADHADFEVKRELGRGGMGVVYLAHNRLMGRDEVLKVVSRDLLDRRGVLDRFLREIRSAARLHHPNIVTAFSAFRSGESIVFAMEYVDGLDLAKIVKTKGPLPVAHACFFIQQVAVGLQHAHEHGLVHRDIKPANLMLAREGKRTIVKVLDFGLAKATREQPVDGGLTREGQMLGTPDYIAPEQIRDALSADIRADIYSLGCTLYYLLTGRPPFLAEKLWDLYQAHHSMIADPLNLVRPEVPSELAALVAKMMAKEPERRFQTPAEVALALSPFFKAESVKGPARTEPSAAGGPMIQARPAPTVPAPEAEAPLARRIEPAEPSSSEPCWQSLIELKETERPTSPLPAPVLDEAPRGPRRWWPGIAAAAGFGAVLLLGIIIHITINRDRVNVEVNRVPEVRHDPSRPSAAPGSASGRTRSPARARPDQPPPLLSAAIAWPHAQFRGGLTLPPSNGRIFAISRDGRRVAQQKGAQPLRITTSPDATRWVDSAQAVGLWGATFSPDGKSLAGYGDHACIWIWDTATGKEVRQIVQGGGKVWRTVQVAFSRDGTRLAAVIHTQKCIRVFDTTSGDLQQTLTGHADSPWCAAFSPDGTRLVTGGGPWDAEAQSPGELKVWDLRTGACLNLAGHTMRTSSVAFSPDARSVVSASFDKTAKVWDVKTLQCTATFARHTGQVVDAQFSGDGRFVASIARENRENGVRVWEAATGREIAVLTGFPKRPHLSVQFSPSGQRIFAVSGNVLKSWETPASVGTERTEASALGDPAGTSVGQENAPGTVLNGEPTTRDPAGSAGKGRVGPPPAPDE